MFDLWIEKARQKMFGKFEKRLVQQGQDKNKVEEFLVVVMPQIVASIAVFLGLLYIFLKAYDKYGIDRIMIVIGILVILTLRTINKNLGGIHDELRRVN